MGDVGAEVLVPVQQALLRLDAVAGHQAVDAAACTVQPRERSRR